MKTKKAQMTAMKKFDTRAMDVNRFIVLFAEKCSDCIGGLL